MYSGALRRALTVVITLVILTQAAGGAFAAQSLSDTDRKHSKASLTQQPVPTNSASAETRSPSEEVTKQTNKTVQYVLFDTESGVKYRLEPNAPLAEAAVPAGVYRVQKTIRTDDGEIQREFRIRVSEDGSITRITEDRSQTGIATDTVATGDAVTTDELEAHVVAGREYEGTYRPGSTVNLSVTATDTDRERQRLVGGVNLSVTVSGPNGTEITKTATSRTQGPAIVPIDLTGLPNGTYEVAVSGSNITYRGTSQFTVGPTADISPKYQSQLELGQTMTVAASLATRGTPIAGTTLRLRIFKPNDTTETKTLTTDAEGFSTFEFSPSQTGYYYIEPLNYPGEGISISVSETIAHLRVNTNEYGTSLSGGETAYFSGHVFDSGAPLANTELTVRIVNTTDYDNQEIVTNLTTTTNANGQFVAMWETPTKPGTSFEARLYSSGNENPLNREAEGEIYIEDETEDEEYYPEPEPSSNPRLEAELLTPTYQGIVAPGGTINAIVTAERANGTPITNTEVNYTLRYDYGIIAARGSVITNSTGQAKISIPVSAAAPDGDEFSFRTSAMINGSNIAEYSYGKIQQYRIYRVDRPDEFNDGEDQESTITATATPAPNNDEDTRQVGYGIRVTDAKTGERVSGVSLMVAADTYTGLTREVVGTGAAVTGADGSATVNFTLPETASRAYSFTPRYPYSEDYGVFGGEFTPYEITVNGLSEEITGGETVSLNYTDSSSTDTSAIVALQTYEEGVAPVASMKLVDEGENFTLTAPGTAIQRNYHLRVYAINSAGVRTTYRDYITITAGGTTNDPPTADAGSDKTVAPNTTVSLNATGSTDPNGDTLSYDWSQTSGPDVTLQNETTATPTFTAPNVTSPTNLTFELEVEDGNVTTSDTVTITVDPSETALRLTAQNAVAVNNGSAYIIANDTIVQVNLETREIIDEIPAPTGTNQGLAYGNGSLWYADGSTGAYSGEVLELNPETGEVRSIIKRGNDPYGIAYGNGHLWVAEVTSVPNEVHKITPSGSEVSSFGIGGPASSDGPQGLAYYNGSIWVGSKTGLYKHSPNGELLESFEDRTIGYKGLAGSETALYGPDANGILSILRSSTSAQPQFAISTVTLPASVSTGEPITVQAKITNTGEQRATQLVNASFIDTHIGSRSITLNSSETRILTFSSRGEVVARETGTYTATVTTVNETASESVEVVGQEFVTGHSTGDPHITTFDGTAYDFMAAGDFVLAREPQGNLLVVARQVPISDSVSVNNATATVINGTRVVIVADRSPHLYVDGDALTLGSGEAITIAGGDGRIVRRSSTYTVYYAGDDGTVTTSDEHLTADIIGDRVDISLSLHPNRSQDVEGLLGNINGSTSDDIAYDNGTALNRPVTPSALYGQFRTDWLATGQTNPFSTDYYRSAFPREFVSIEDLSETVRNRAEATLADTCLVPGTPQYQDALLDIALTGDTSYIASACQVDKQNVTDAEETASGTTLERAVHFTVNQTHYIELGFSGPVSNLRGNITLFAGGQDVSGSIVDQFKPSDGQVVLELDREFVDPLTIRLEDGVTSKTGVPLDPQNVSVTHAPVTVLSGNEKSIYRGSKLAVGTNATGATVALYNNGELVREITTGENSQIAVVETENLSLGSYRVEIGAVGNATVTLRDLGLDVDVEQTTINSSGVLNGTISANAANRAVEVSLVNDAGSPVGIEQTLTLDGSGEATFSLDLGTTTVPAGTYQVQVTDVHSGIQYQSQSVAVESTPVSTNATLSATDAFGAPGSNVTVRFNLTNQGPNKGFILDTNRNTSAIQVVDQSADGGRWNANETKWLWQTVESDTSVTPSLTVRLPESAQPGTSYTISAEALTADGVAARTNATVSTRLPIDKAIDTNDNGRIDDLEILQAIEYWRNNTAVPKTGGRTIGDFEILNLIEMWRLNKPV